MAVDANGTVVASSAPSRYPPGRAAASELPAEAIAVGHNIGKQGGSASTPYGSVLWAVCSGGAGAGPLACAAGPVAYVYVQAPWSTGLINPIRVWNELGQQPGTDAMLSGAYALLFAIVPVGVLFGLLASRRLVRRCCAATPATACWPAAP